MTEVSPHLWIFLLLVLLAVAMIFAFGWILLKRKSLSQTQWKWQTLLGLGAVALIGAVLIVKESQGLYEISEKRQWTQVSGKILESEMRGKKAYIPFVKYEYERDGKTYVGETELYSPQWGGKLLRKETSENILSMFKPQSAIAVYVNPKNESESALELYFGWDLFIRLGVGAFLWLLATAALSFLVFQPIFLHNLSSRAKP